MTFLSVLVAYSLISSPIPAFAEISSSPEKPFSPSASSEIHQDNSSSPKTCFTPGQDCTDFILQIVNQAQTSILVQAYEFTSLPIAQGLCQAAQRGVRVEILLDRSQLTQKRSQLSLFQQVGIPVYIDKVSGIAHNKVMIIDHKTVLTGSFNWTDSAQKRNAENLLWIQDPICTQSYLENWISRRQKAVDPNTLKSHVTPPLLFENLLSSDI